MSPPPEPAGSPVWGAYSKTMVRHQRSIGNRIAPPRFLVFFAVALVAVPVAIVWSNPSAGLMAGFDLAAAAFLMACAPLLRETSTEAMRRASARNDANRAMLLVISGVASIAVLAAIAGELGAAGHPEPPMIALIVATLMLAWAFGNAVYALHYAHMFYVSGAGGEDTGGFDFPDCAEPAYWDFLYFAFTLGMTFQTSDVDITTTPARKVATAHSLAAFIFNLGIVAFTINVLGGG